MAPGQREALRQWRLASPVDELRAVKKKFDDAGVHILACNIPMDDTFTDAEIVRVFPMAQALGRNS